MSDGNDMMDEVTSGERALRSDLSSVDGRPVRLPRSPSAHCTGSFSFSEPELRDIAARSGNEAAWVAAFERHGVSAPSKAYGDFAVAVRDRAGRMLLAVDRFAIRTLCYRIDGEGELAFHQRADVLAMPDATSDPQAIFDYLYFHVIPAPRTIYQGVARLPPGHYALVDRGRLTVARWWTPRFVEDAPADFAALREEFLAILRRSIARSLDTRSVACFLSGGTDSSTVAGLVGEATGRAARTFSIGFDAEGYDEMAYARLAARHFGTDHHEYYVTPDDVVESVPQIAAYYDQPFGNSSVAAAYACARQARDAGIELLLAGDGGDELFGGNSRYAKQRIFDAYRHVPRWLRASLVEPALLGSAVLGRVPGIRKLVSYVEQARVPMPDRMQLQNLTEHLGYAEILTPEFLAEIDPASPLRLQRETYDDLRCDSIVNRMLAYDWRFTLADNDLPKVQGATSMAGVAVGFPLLDDELVDFSLRLAPHLKVRGLKLRWFFKQALRGFLPEEILRKKKHGFGLPFGMWTTTHPRLRELAFDSARSLGSRGIVRAAFIDRLIGQNVAEHPAYYGEMLWILMMLEQWFASRRRKATA
jgi:asparagine synthase (glutamine-hydrolysing)